MTIQASSFKDTIKTISMLANAYKSRFGWLPRIRGPIDEVISDPVAKRLHEIGEELFTIGGGQKLDETIKALKDSKQQFVVKEIWREIGADTQPEAA